MPMASVATPTMAITAMVAPHATQYGAALLRPRRATLARRLADAMPGRLRAVASTAKTMPRPFTRPNTRAARPAAMPTTLARAVQTTTGHQDGGLGREALNISSGNGTSNCPCCGYGMSLGVTAPYAGAGAGSGGLAHGGAVG